MKTFTDEFRKSAVKKALSRGQISIVDICKGLNIAKPTLYQWIKTYGKQDGMIPLNSRPQDWSLEQRFKAVFTYESLNDDERGKFLRENGLYSNNLIEWKADIQKCFENQKSDAAMSRNEKLKFQTQIKELQNDLHRKEKALAETAALLILKKKADLIWGTGVSE